jgi:Bifunctional DNA primase/polymerase, N-terminal
MGGLLNEAINIALQGFPVFPVRLCSAACLKCDICKAPASPHGFHDATLDAEGISALWKECPGQLIGVPTGKISNVDVLDLDSARHPEAVNWWMSNRQRIPHTRTHQTGSGGLHIFFRHNELARTGNGRLGEGIDVKANGGYVVWWPAFGRKIAHEGPISEWPDWLIAKQQPRPPRDFFPNKPGSHTSLEPVAKFVASLVQGKRNNGTFWGFCRAFETVNAGGVSVSEAVHVVTQAALSTGLTEREVRPIARSARLRACNGY